MAIVSDTGITPTSLTVYQTLLQTAFKAAFGEGIDLAPKSPAGQWVDSIALSMSQADDVVISVAGAVNIFRAFEAQLEGLAALLGIPKNEAESTIVSVSLGGTPGTTIIEGSRARSDAGDLYQLDDDITLDVSGVATGVMSGVETGLIELLAGELTSLADVVPGWETVNNAADGVTGRDIESDSVYRQRYFTELFRNALSVLESVISGVSEQDNVTEVIGVENDTDSPVVIQGVTIDSHSIGIVVEGGLDQSIADAIRLKKTGGTGTTGTTSVSDPPHVDINFFRPDFINIEVVITTEAGPTFPSNGIQLLKERVFNYINGNSSIEENEGFFELDGMKISEDLQKHRLYTPINSVPGHSVSDLVLEDKAIPIDVDLITADLDEKIQILSLDDIGVSLT